MTGIVAMVGLASALSLSDHELVALVGGGGKTTAAFALGAQLGSTTIITTTTKMGSDRTGGFTPMLDPSTDEIRAALTTRETVLVWKGDDGRRGHGVAPATCDAWFAVADHVIVEADGSRRLPFKAPADHEPVVPRATTMLVACVGSPAFDGVIAEVCHRPERVAAVAGCTETDRLTPTRLVSVLLSPEGSRKGCPPRARFAVLLNRVTPDHVSYVEEVEHLIGGAATVVAVESYARGESGGEPG